MKHPHKLRIQFLGQCIAGNGDGRLAAAYPQITQQLLSAAFPSLTFETNVCMLSHPRGLKALVRSRLLFFKPDIMVISLPAMFAAIPTGVDLINQLAPELTVTARSFLRRIDAKLTGGLALETTIKKAFRWRPTKVYSPLAIDEYERLITEAVEFSRSTSPCRVILFGPGGLNEDTKTDTAGTPELSCAVNRMVLRSGRQLGVSVVNASDLIAEHDGSVFMPGSNVYSQRGHEVVAREVYSVVASQLLTSPTGSKDRGIETVVDPRGTTATTLNHFDLSSGQDRMNENGTL